METFGGLKQSIQHMSPLIVPLRMVFGGRKKSFDSLQCAG
jgi:hypothetical protein